MKRSLEIARALVEQMESEVKCYQHSLQMSDFTAFPGLSIAIEALLDGEAGWSPKEEAERSSLYARYGEAFDFEFKRRPKPKK